MFSKNDWESKSLDEKINIIYFAIVGLSFVFFWPFGIMALLLGGQLKGNIKTYIEKNKGHSNLNKTELSREMINKAEEKNSKEEQRLDNAQKIETYKAQTISQNTIKKQDLGRNLLAAVAIFVFLVAIILYFVLT